MAERYKEKLIEVQAIQFRGDEENVKEICKLCNCTIYGYLWVYDVLSGIVLQEYKDETKQHHLSIGDYIAIDPSGTVKVFDRDYFRLKYKKVEEDADTDIQQTE